MPEIQRRNNRIVYAFNGRSAAFKPQQATTQDSQSGQKRGEVNFVKRREIRWLSELEQGLLLDCQFGRCCGLKAAVRP